MNKDKENIKKLVQEIKKLRTQVANLEDENESLWFMLNELDRSNINNFPEIFEKIQEKFVKDPLSYLLTSKKVGKA